MYMHMYTTQIYTHTHIYIYTYVYIYIYTCTYVSKQNHVFCQEAQQMDAKISGWFWAPKYVTLSYIWRGMGGAVLPTRVSHTCAPKGLTKVSPQRTRAARFPRVCSRRGTQRSISYDLGTRISTRVFTRLSPKGVQQEYTLIRLSNLQQCPKTVHGKIAAKSAYDIKVPTRVSQENVSHLCLTRVCSRKGSYKCPIHK